VLFTLEALPAEEGDCLLLHWGTRKNQKQPKIALIDAGPGRVYENHLRPRLEELVTNLGVAQLPLELVMVSHMDSDHVVGIMKLFSVLKKEIDNQKPVADRTVRAERLWLNVFNDILNDSVDAYFTALSTKVQASVNGKPNPKLIEQLEKKLREKDEETDERQAEFDARTIAAVLASHGEGRTLRDDHHFLMQAGQTATLNHPFTNADGKPTLITLEKTPKPLTLADLKITITGPSDTEIQKLQEEFDKYIKEKGLTAEAVLAAYADKSVKNLSSIVCLVEFGKGAAKKTMFLTGDARGDLIIEGLKKKKLLKNGKLVVDIFKVPHHGSDNNAEPELFEQIVADTYVLSGDGQHGNPERATLGWITDARGKNARYDLVLTYDIATIDKNRKADWETKQKRKKPENRKAWDHDTMSLETFFAEKKAAGYKFKLLNGARKIDLGDEKVDY
jgi:beta-lactamase superfamily II metal-dependent hydrolase